MSKSLLQLNKVLAASPTEDLAGNPSAKPFYVGLVVVDPVRQLILLGERLEDGYITGPGGGAEAGETAENAAVREAYEESNLRLSPHQLEALPPNVCRNGKICHCFLVQVDSESPDLDIHPHNDPDEEVAEWRWYPLHGALPGKTTDARLQTINHARMRILGLSKGSTAESLYGILGGGVLGEETLEDEALEKGRKPFPVGTMRIYGGQKYVKHVDGWVAVTGDHHGKLMGNFKGGQATHTAHADQYKDVPAETEKPEEAPAVKAPEAKVEAKPVAKEVAKPEGKKGLRNPPTIEVRAENGAHVGYINGRSVTLPTSKDHAEALTNLEKKTAEIEANAHNLTQKEFIKQYIEAKGYRDSKKTRDILKRRHQGMVTAASKEGFHVPEEVLNDYAELVGLPPELQDSNQAKTNLFKSADLSKVPKKRKPEVFKLLKDANSIVAHIGVSFKESLHFRADSSLKEGDKKSTRATYEGGGGDHRSIALKDVSKAETSIMHEIGHAIDYAMADSPGSSVTRSDQMSKDQTELGAKWRELMDLVRNSEKYQNTESGKHKSYLTKPTEVFARAFEVYALGKARELAAKGKIEKSFVEDYLPDIFQDPKSPGRLKTMEAANKLYSESQALTQKVNEKYRAHKAEVEKTVTGYSEVSLKVHELMSGDSEVKDWQKQSSDLLNQRRVLLDSSRDGKDLIIPQEKQEAYISKITSLMDYIINTDKIRKSLAQDLLIEELITRLN